MILAAEVPVRGRLRKDRPPQLEVLQDGTRTQVEMLADELLEPIDGNARGVERLHRDRDRMCDSDRVRDVDFASIREPRRDQVLRHVACRIGRRAIDLGRILAGERSAPMTRRATVGVDDDLATRQPSVAHRPAQHELAGRVDEDEVTVVHQPLLVVQVGRKDRVQDAFDDVRLDQVLRRDPVGVLRRDEHALDLNGPLPPILVDLVADRHLRLAVRPQVRELACLAHLREPLADLVREHDRKGHQLVRLVRRVPEHHALVAGAGPVERIVVAGVVLKLVRRVDALRDIRRLLVDRHDHAARRRVEAPLGVRVADLRDPFAHELRDVHVRPGGDLPCDHDEAGRDQRLAGNAPVGVVREDGVEDGIRDLVGDLVGMTFGHRLRAEEELAPGHGGEGYTRGGEPSSFTDASLNREPHLEPARRAGSCTERHQRAELFQLLRLGCARRRAPQQL